MMADLEEDGGSSRFDDIDVESILSRVERRGPLTFTKRRCLYRAPEFVKKLSGEETVDEGATVSFTCKVIAFPKPTLSLFKDGEKVTDCSRISIDPGEVNGEFTLVIRNVKKSDEASYRCKAENAEGSSSTNIYVAVKAKSRSPKKSPSRAGFLRMFPPITENAEEEEREAEEARRQPESPLTHLLYGLTWKNRTWPEFLGSWAFVNGVSARDFDAMDNDMDDEDVFLSDDSDDDIRHNIPSKDKCHTDEGFYDDSLHYNGEHSENKNGGITIPNLVFENKNLVRSEGRSDLTFFTTDRPLKLTRDVNANKHIIKQGSTSQITQASRLGDVCKDGDKFRKNSNVGKDRDVCTSSPELPDERYCDNKISTTSTLSQITRPPCLKEQSDGDLTEVALLLSSTTLMALYYEMTPSVFVFTVLIGQLLYCLIRFLLRSL